MSARRRRPKCQHARRGIVTAGGSGGGHAATNVCDRAGCIADAIAWAEDITGQRARYLPDRPDRPDRGRGR